MACACKVNQQLAQIEREYGVKRPSTIKRDVLAYVKTFFKKTFLWILFLPLLPFLFLSVMFRGIFTKKPIKLDKIIKSKK